MNISFEVAKMEQERNELRQQLDGLRAGLAGEPVPETTCEALERGREEGEKIRASILASCRRCTVEVPAIPDKYRGGVDGVETATERSAAGVGAHTFSAPLDPKAPVTGTHTAKVGGTEFQTEHLHWPGPATLWARRSTQSMRHYNDAWAGRDPLVFRLDAPVEVALSLIASVSEANGASVGVSLNGNVIEASKVTFHGDGPTSWAWPNSTQGDEYGRYIVSLPAGAHTLMLLAHGALRIDRWEIGAAIVPPPETEPPTEEWRRRWLSEAEIAGVRALLARDWT